MINFISDDDLVEKDKKIWRDLFVCVDLPLTATLDVKYYAKLTQLILLFFSCMFQKIYKEELNAYMVV